MFKANNASHKTCKLKKLFLLCHHVFSLSSMFAVFFLMLTHLQICMKLCTLANLLYNDYFAKKCGINCILLRLVISLEIIAPHSQSIRGNRSCFLAHSAGCMTLPWFLTDSYDCVSFELTLAHKLLHCFFNSIAANCSC